MPPELACWMLVDCAFLDDPDHEVVFVFDVCWFVADYYMVIVEKTPYFCSGCYDCSICFCFVGTIEHASERIVVEVTSW